MEPITAVILSVLANSISKFSSRFIKNTSPVFLIKIAEKCKLHNCKTIEEKETYYMLVSSCDEEKSIPKKYFLVIKYLFSVDTEKPSKGVINKPK